MDQLKIESIAGSREGVRILRLTGPFTLQDVFAFQGIVRKATDPVTIVDLTAVPYMDSASLGSIVGVHTSTQTHGRKYALVGVSDRLHTLFRVAGVDKILITYATVEEAEAKLTGSAAGN